MKRLPWGGLRPFVKPLLGLSLLSISLYVIQSIRDDNWRDWYLLWNLFLAWIPLLLAAGLAQLLRTRSWSDWLVLGIAAAWLIFLPNSFYIISDFIHLSDPHHQDILAAAITFFAFSVTGLVLGLMSLGVVQRLLEYRLPRQQARGMIAGVILLSSFAIYLGRDLRWNSWDVLLNPAGILFDVSDRLVNPGSHPQALVITLIFFLLISAFYGIGRGLARAAGALPKK
jgi:uncharacterized membrane protein